MNTKNKTIAGIMIATIALASVAIAVSAEGEGGVQPAAIMPGAITSEHIADGTITADDINTEAEISGEQILNKTILNGDIGDDEINTTLIANETIDNGDLGPNAIPHILNYSATNVSFSSAQEEVLNTTTSNDVLTIWDDKDFIITYSANCTCTGAAVNITEVCVLYDNGTYLAQAIPDDEIRFADGSGGYGHQSTVVFYANEVAGGHTYGINVTMDTSSGETGIAQQTLIVQAI